MYKEKYIFPAIVKFNKEDNVYYINFPNFKNGFTFSSSENEILKDSKEVLEIVLSDYFENNLQIPEPIKIDDIKEINSAIILVEVWTPLIMDKLMNQSVKKTLTIPKWLNDVAVENNVNFSKVLQAAIKDYLGIEKR